MKDEQLAQLRANLEGRSAAASKLYGDAVAPMRANYAHAEQAAAAVNEAVANRLKKQGTEAGQSLLERLALINAPGSAVEPVTKEVADYYSGAGGANYAGNTGDIQTLIGRSAEEEAWLNKQPAIVRQQLEQQFAADQADLMSEFLDRQFELTQQGLSERDAYDQAHWEFTQGKAEQTKAEKAQKAKDDEDRYWENYWKKQDLLQRQWEIKVASGDKKAANKLKAELEANKIQAQKDIASIRADATVTSAATRADATVTAADIRAQASKEAKAANQNKPPSSADRNRALKAAYSAVIRPDGQVRYDAGMGGKARAVTLINQALQAAGIAPNSPAGKAIRQDILNRMRGRVIAGSEGPTQNGKTKSKKKRYTGQRYTG